MPPAPPMPPASLPPPLPAAPPAPPAPVLVAAVLVAVVVAAVVLAVVDAPPVPVDAPPELPVDGPEVELGERASSLEHTVDERRPSTAIETAARGERGVPNRGTIVFFQWPEPVTEDQEKSLNGAASAARNGCAEPLHRALHLRHAA